MYNFNYNSLYVNNYQNSIQFRITELDTHKN